MSFLAYFFTATDEQLAQHFAGWSTVKPEPKSVKKKNPFTGQMLTVEQWIPAKKLGKGEANPFDTIDELSPVVMKNIDPIKLASLAGIVAEVPYEEMIETLLIPKLLAPEEEMPPVIQIPTRVLTALSNLSDEQITAAAKTWAKTEELKLDRWKAADCVSVINELKPLFAASLTAKAPVYYLLLV
jgi:hypothetical protein